VNDGAFIDYGVHERAVRMLREDPERIPATALAAGGTHKIPIMLASLRRGFVQMAPRNGNTARCPLEAK
jgi:DNA-binding transcriptional regulator LsrR (DeoR family)